MDKRKQMNSYELSRSWFDHSFENPDMVKPIHTAIYFFAIEHCNRLGWKTKFGFPTNMTMEAIGMKSYGTYKKHFDEIVEWGFFKVHQYSKNQHSSNVIELMLNDKASSKALDKALTKHASKQRQSTEESTGSIDKQVTSNQINQEQEEDYTLETDFDIFWKAYDYNVGLRQTQDEWSIITKEMPSEIPKILINVPKYVVSKPDKKYRKKPENYLKERIWQDEIEELNNQSKKDIPVHQRSYDERVKFAEENGIKLGSAQYNRLVNKTGL